MELTDIQNKIFSRHLLMPEIGEAGQKKLLSSRVLVIGAGGLGSPAILYLASAGIGTLGLVDPDRVDLSNLQRQVIHSRKDIDRLKVESASEKVKDMDPDIHLKLYPEAFDEHNAEKIVESYDFILDCTDNFAAKYLINDVCHRFRKPYSHGGIYRFEGQTMTVIPGETACYRCVFSSPPKGEERGLGIFAPAPGIVGIIQATEAIKFVLEIGSLMTNRLFICNALNGKMRTVPVKINPNCSLCRNEI